MPRRYVTMSGPMTEAEARRKYPNPRFVRRPRRRMRRGEAEALLVEHIEEMHRALALLRGCSGLPVAYLVRAANALHDARLALDIQGGDMGAPVLWEE